MPLTSFQASIAKLLSSNRTEDSHLAGGAALHFAPNSKRFSNDLDFFHDSVERVAEAYENDSTLLEKSGYEVTIEMKQPGYIRAHVGKGAHSTKIEWAHDSAWRFMPAIVQKEIGFQLHPVDLAINKVLALAGRDEARDFLDILMIHKEILPLGALCWAATGKDPGFSPLSLIELLKRRGKYRPEDFSRLLLASPVDLPTLKTEWLEALADAEKFIRAQPPDEIGCLYYAPKLKRFVAPDSSKPRDSKEIIPHHGRPGGVLPAFYQGDILAENIEALKCIA